MSQSLLLLILTVSGVDGSVATLDSGLLEGLRPGDTGRVYYELTIGAQKKEIEVGPATVIEADELGARCDVPAETRPGYLIRFELPTDRVLPATLIQLARSRLEERGYDDTLRNLLSRIIPEDEQIEREIIEMLRQRRSSLTQAAASAATAAPKPEPPAAEAVAEREPERVEPAAPKPPPATVAPATTAPAPVTAVRGVTREGGSYAVGLDLADAEFYSQHPRFRIQLDPFELDRHMVTREDFLAYDPDVEFPKDGGEFATNVSFDEAVAYCASRAGRLPTEFEWEVVMADRAVEPGLLEWTHSWYKPYPGNSTPEEEYGEAFRVLRGAADPTKVEAHRRRFAGPETRHPKLGFRCARDHKAS